MAERKTVLVTGASPGVLVMNAHSKPAGRARDPCEEALIWLSSASSLGRSVRPRSVPAPDKESR